MRILVIGSRGQVGSEIEDALSLGFATKTQKPEVVLATRTELDLSDYSEILSFLVSKSPDIIINASAYTAVDKAESEKSLAFAINDLAVREMARYCYSNNAKLIHISTDYVFDGSSEMFYKESDATGPQGIYGSSKLAGENSIREILDKHIILRTSWVFGSRGSNFVKTMVGLANGKKKINVVADQFGAPTSAKAIAVAIAEIVCLLAETTVEDKRWGTYHFSGYPCTTWFEFAQEILMQAEGIGLIQSAPRVIPITTSEFPTSAVRPVNSRLDCSKLQSTFGVEPDDWKISLGLVLDELKEGMQI